MRYLAIFVFWGMIFVSIKVHAVGCEFCSEPNCEDYLICENWDLDDPGNFPFTPGSVYHDARAGNYGWSQIHQCSHGVKMDISTMDLI